MDVVWTPSGVYRRASYAGEADLEASILHVQTALFGANRIYLDVKKRIGGKNGPHNIPDGYLVDLTFSCGAQAPGLSRGESAASCVCATRAAAVASWDALRTIPPPHPSSASGGALPSRKAEPAGAGADARCASPAGRENPLASAMGSVNFHIQGTRCVAAHTAVSVPWAQAAASQEAP